MTSIAKLKAVANPLLLRARLDEIDREAVERGAEKMKSLHELEIQAQWLKGREVLAAYPDLVKPAQGGRGVGAGFSEVERETGRKRETIAKWVKLFLAHPEENKFLPWATREAERRTENWQFGVRGMQRVRDLTRQIPPPAGLYSVILADPPWRYDFAETDSRQIENQYPTMEVEEICSIGSSMPFAENAVLFLWATAPKLIEALDVISAWGFDYKTHAVWDKEVIGMGYWFRGQHEPLMVATRGEFSPPPQEARISSVIRSRRGAHSEKPSAVHELLEAAYPQYLGVGMLEVFARKKRAGWEVWGNEVADAA